MMDLDESYQKASEKTTENLIPEIASVYKALADLHQKASHLWPEDEDPLILCLDALFDAALGVECKTPEDCLALLAIAKSPDDLQWDSNGPFDMAERRVLEFALNSLPHISRVLPVTI